MNWKILTTVFLSIGLLLSGCNSTNEPEGKAAENTGGTETDKETKEKETTEPILVLVKGNIRMVSRGQS